MKENFIFHLENEEDLEDLSIEQKGLIFCAMIQFTKDGTEPGFEDPFLRAAWRPIRRRLTNDAEKYEERCQKNFENGKRGGRPKNQTVSEKTEKTERFSEKPKKPDTDSDSDTDTDTDSISDKESISLSDNEREDAQPRERAKTEIRNSFRVLAAFHQFEELRKRLSRPIDESNEELIWSKLESLSQGDEGKAVQILNQAIEGGYYTLAPVKASKQKTVPFNDFAQHSEQDLSELEKKMKLSLLEDRKEVAE